MKRQEHRSVSALAALVLLCVFAVGILTALLGGAEAYSRLTQRDSQSYNRRTCAQYIATKLRQSPSAEQVSVAPFGEGDALVLRQHSSDGDYVTRVYCHEGWLKELFAAEDSGLLPSDGEKILPLEGFSAEKDGNLIKLCLSYSADESVTELIHLEGEGATP